LVIFLLAEPIVVAFFGERYANIVPLLDMLLMVAFVTNGLRFTSANLLAAMGKIRVNMIVSFAGTVGQIVLNLLLIPEFGVYGAAMTSIVVYSAMAMGVLVPFVKMYGKG
jgi:O-antigen/teichoic acid export membrane protein